MMREAIRFHLDEHLPPAIAEGLRRRGIDVTTALEAGLLGAADEGHLGYAFAESRVLVTRDTDFLRLSRHGASHAGIAFCPGEIRSIGKIIHGLVLIYECLDPQDMRNHVEFL
jgi:hypothetical protein